MGEPLLGRVAVVTGVSRRDGIGYAVARELAGRGASLFLHHYQPHDREQPWGADDISAVVDELAGCVVDGARIDHMSMDLQQEGGAEAVITAARSSLGHLDILVCNHARSGGDGDLKDLDATLLDGHWQVNTRSTLLLTKHFAAQHDGRAGGRAIWMTSGQQLGAMRGEVAYATSKAALAGVTQTVADELVEQRILLNTVNPGPVNTGYLEAETTDRDREVVDKVKASFPLGRFGRPEDPARLIAWLASDEAGWVVGQVLNIEGGFRRW